MADSRFDKLNYDKINDTCSCSNRLHAFLRLHNVLLNFSGQCYRCCNGHMQLRQDKSLTADGQMWRCTNRKCTAKNSIRKHSFFAGSHLSLATITKLVYYGTHKYQEIVLCKLGSSSKTVVDFYNFCREVCTTVLEQHSEPIVFMLTVAYKVLIKTTTSTQSSCHNTSQTLNDLLYSFLALSFSSHSQFVQNHLVTVNVRQGYACIDACLIYNLYNICSKCLLHGNIITFAMASCYTDSMQKSKQAKQITHQTETSASLSS